MNAQQYLVVIERGEKPGSFGAYVPDLPGCVAVGSTRARVRKLIGEAIAEHIDGMLEDGLPVPEPSSTAALVAVTLSAKPKRLARRRAAATSRR